MMTEWRGNYSDRKSNSNALSVGQASAADASHLWTRKAQVSETLCAVLNAILYNEKRKKHVSPKQNCTLEPCTINNLSEFLRM